MAGKFTISTINVMAEGRLNLNEDIQYLLVLTSLNIAPSGVIQSADLVIQTTSVTIEEGGVLDLNEGGDFKMGDGR